MGKSRKIKRRVMKLFQHYTQLLRERREAEAEAFAAAHWHDRTFAGAVAAHKGIVAGLMEGFACIERKRMGASRN